MNPTTTTAAAADASGGARAVIYLRVSTTAQADRDFDEEGFSIPAQRDACHRKAEALGAVVVGEYLDRGESARSADRASLQAMLKRLGTDRDVDYVIVHKIDRLARSLQDDVMITLDIRSAGAKLVSATESVDETPSGKLLHGIMATIAEFYSGNLATEAIKGMTKKAQKGGTPGRAPIGYLNVGADEGKKRVRYVAIDDERAPLVRWAFAQYASGEWTTQGLTDALNAKGLRSKPVGKKPAMPLQKSRVAHLLANPYYIGIVTFRGVQYPGRHEPLISRALFDQVQSVLAAKNRAGDKTRRHHHYLKGSVFCGQCGARLVFSRNTGHGGVYDYFKCMGRQHRIDCVISYIRADWLEAAVADEWSHVQLDEDLLTETTRSLNDELESSRHDSEIELARQTKRLTALTDERTTLLRAHLHGAVPLDLLKVEQDRIGREMVDAQAVIDAATITYHDIETTLERAVQLAGNCHQAYLQGTPLVRRQLNQTFFTRIEVHPHWPDQSVKLELATPFRELHAATQPANTPVVLSPATGETTSTQVRAKQDPRDKKRVRPAPDPWLEHERFGAPGRIRTSDQRIRSPSLYPLSYGRSPQFRVPRGVRGAELTRLTA